MDLSTLVGDWTPEIRTGFERLVQECLRLDRALDEVDDAKFDRNDAMAQLRELGLSSLAVEAEIRRRLDRLKVDPKRLGVSHDTVRRARRRTRTLGD